MATDQVHEIDVPLADGRTLHAYDRGPDDGLPVFWLHGTPNIGTPPRPLYEAGDRLGVRWLGYDRPGYGGSTSNRGRDVASAADAVAAVADHLGIGRFGVVGHSGGGPHALACGALLGDRVTAVVCGSGLAPYDAAGLDWFAGLGEAGAATLRAAAAGRAERARYEEEHPGPEPDFNDADLAALEGPWGWFGEVVVPALASGPEPAIDDDVAFTHPWGFDPLAIAVPTLVLHGGEDRLVPGAHGRWLASAIPGAELWFDPAAGHLSILDRAPDALAWLVSRSG